MNKTIGIILILFGLFAAFMAFGNHSESKKTLDIGKLEISKETKKPNGNTLLFGVLAAGLIIGGGIMVSKK